MKKTITVAALACIITANLQAQKNSKVKVHYPQTTKTSQTDEYFGEKINDPYRWLEDDRSENTSAWVKEQNKTTYDYLKQIPYRDALKKRMQQLWNYERISAPFKEGNYTYYYKNNGLQNQSILYRKDLQGNEEIFLDPNKFSTDGTSSLGEIDFSEDGTKVAYEISAAGSDWRKIMIMDAVTKTVLEDAITDVKFGGISWKGNEGFYYSKYDKPTGSELSAKTDHHKLYYHQLGTSQKTDKVIFGLEQNFRYVRGFVTEDNRFLIISTANTTYGNGLYIQDLTKTDSPLITVLDNLNSSTRVIDNKGDILYLLTDYKAPNKRLVQVNISNPSPENWKDCISETENVLDVTKAGGNFFAQYSKDALSLVKQFDYNGKFIREIQLPGLGTATGFSAKKDEKETYFTFANYLTPGTVYSLDLETGISKLYSKPKSEFQSENYVSEQVFYTSKDGTKIPMIITYKKGLKLNGKNPTILYGYGGFNVSLPPSFSAANAVWIENGGIYAVANLRGGGEYGKKWHVAGTKMQKQNVFDDFIAGAEYLISKKYTSKDFLAIRGGSNGGLLVGAVMTQRPDLMKVALPQVGVLDMLRYHKFTAGAGWAYDFGTSEDSKEMFEYIKNYSPLHNVKKGAHYPSTMVTTGDHDDRVVPAHSFKFAATLQDNADLKTPQLIRIDINAGHGAGKSVSATIQENADIQSFALFEMGIKTLPELK